MGAIQRLNLALFIDAEDDGLVRGIKIDAHHIGELLHKALVARKLESPALMRFEPVQVPDPLHGLEADALGFGHRAATPMRLARRLAMLGGVDEGRNLLPLNLRLAPSARSHLGQSLRPALHEAPLPKPDCGLTGLQAFADGFVAPPAVRFQNNQAPQRDVLRGGSGFDPPLQ